MIATTTWSVSERFVAFKEAVYGFLVKQSAEYSNLLGKKDIVNSVPSQSWLRFDLKGLRIATNQDTIEYYIDRNLAGKVFRKRKLEIVSPMLDLGVVLSLPINYYRNLSTIFSFCYDYQTFRNKILLFTVECGNERG